MKCRISVLMMFLVMILVTGCTAEQKFPDEMNDVAEYLENKGFDIVSYEGQSQSYVLPS